METNTIIINGKSIERVRITRGTNTFPYCNRRFRCRMFG